MSASGILLITAIFKACDRTTIEQQRFEAAYVVILSLFCALRARGACEAGFFFMDQFLLPRWFQRGWVPEVCFIPQGGRQTDRENRHYENIYIDETCRRFVT